MDTEIRDDVLIFHCYVFKLYALSGVIESFNTNDPSKFTEVMGKQMYQWRESCQQRPQVVCKQRNTIQTADKG